MQIEGFSISPQQARLWELKEQGSFRACAALGIKGPLDPQRLRQSLAHLTANHEILRTAFLVSPGVKMPLQVIGDEAGLETISQTDQNWQELLQAETGAVMNPDKPIMPRVAILPQDANNHVLIFSMPSLCCDGWNLNRLAVEVGTLYASLASNEEEEAEPVQYTDYADWLEELEEEQEGARLFWEERKAEMAPQCPLASFQQTATAPYSLARLQLKTFPLQEIRGAAQAMNLSPQALWLSSWQVLLARFGNQPQLSTAVAFHGRSFDELETAFGTFARFLPLTCHITPSMAFHEFAETVAAEITRFNDRQDFFKPGKLNPATAFEWQEARPSHETGDLCFSVLDVRHHMEPFACKLQITETANGFLPELTYNRGLFSETFISRLGDHLLILLGNLMENPKKRI